MERSNVSGSNVIKAAGTMPFSALRGTAANSALTGDIIVETYCHGIDVLNWFLGGHPERAYGTGGRTDRGAWRREHADRDSGPHGH